MTSPAAPARSQAPHSPATLPARTSRQRPGPATPTHTLVLDPDDHAPRHARAATRTSLTLWGLPHLIDDAQAITSELVTNAAAASQRAAPPGTSPARIVLWLTTQAGELIIRVWDPEPTAPPAAPPAPGPDEETGRGLMIIDALSARRDWTPGPNGGKHVTAALPTQPQRSTP